jgi:hypothetical protein
MTKQEHNFATMKKPDDDVNEHSPSEFSTNKINSLDFTSLHTFNQPVFHLPPAATSLSHSVQQTSNSAPASTRPSFSEVAQNTPLHSLSDNMHSPIPITKVMNHSKDQINGYAFLPMSSSFPSPSLKLAIPNSRRRSYTYSTGRFDVTEEVEVEENEIEVLHDGTIDITMDDDMGFFSPKSRTKSAAITPISQSLRDSPYKAEATMMYFNAIQRSHKQLAKF